MGEKTSLPDDLILAVFDFLGQEGRSLFKGYQSTYGSVAPIVPGKLPHPVHWREGMSVRNFMRQSHLCAGWTDSDYDNNWVRVVERVLEIE